MEIKLISVTKRRNIVVRLAGVGIGAVVLFMLLTREPVYDGKGVTLWLEDLSHNDSKVREKAQSVLVKAGPEIVPQLIQALKRSNSTFSGVYISLRERMPMFIMERMPYPMDKVIYRYNAANILSEFGPAAKSAVPQLQKLLTDEDEDVRSVAAIALGSIGPEASEAIPGLLVLTGSSNAQCRVNAAWALWNIDPTGHTATATRILTGALLEPGTPGLNATDMLAETGKAALAVPPLMKALQSPYSNQRIQAAKLLGRIGPEAQGSVAALTITLSDTNSQVRLNAARALGKMGPVARDALPRLIETRPRESGMFSNIYAEAIRKIEERTPASGK